MERRDLTFRARLRSSETALALAALVALGASLPFLHVATPRIFFAFALLVSASEMFEITLPNGTAYSLGLAPGLGYALYGHHSVAETLAAFAVGVCAAMLVRAATRENLRITDDSIHLLALAGAAGVFEALQHIPSLAVFGKSNPTGAARLSLANFGALVATAVAMLVAVVLIETVLHALRTARRDQVPMGPVFMALLRSMLELHLSILSVGALLALSYPTLGNWAFPLFLAPLAATQYAFRQLASINKTYLQTIRALSKVPEMAGYTPKGHSSRVADMAVAIARELGVDEKEVSEIQYAALLHDIGRVSLADPESEEATGMELAVVGATIVRETGFFPHVADMIEHQHLAYRRRGEDSDRDLSVGARAIKVANAFDELTNRGGPGHSTRDALEKLRLGMAYDYDPTIVLALTRVLEKRGAA